MVISPLALGFLVIGNRGDTSRDFGKLPAIAKEIIARTKKDQDGRFHLMSLKDQKALMAAIPAMQAMDADNTAWMHKVVDKVGWPSRSLVGAKASDDAWLLVQHADADKAFQRRCLALILPFMDKGEVKKQNVALLIDRVMVGEGRPQVYGSQWKFVNGDIVPSTPIADEKRVDSRRKAMNLDTLAEYKEILKKVYGNALASSKKSGN